MKTYVLNSAVLTNFGGFQYDQLSPDAAKVILQRGFTSAIGHEPTAQALSALVSLEIPFNRIEISMQPGDQAVVFRVKQRLAEGQVLTPEEARRLEFELGVIRCLPMQPSNKVGLIDEPRTFVRFLLNEKRTLLVSSGFVALACLGFFWYQPPYWNILDMIITILTFLVGLVVFFQEARQEMQESLPKRLNVYIQKGGRTIMACRDAPLAHEGDARQWGQQIGKQMCGGINMEFSPYIDLNTLGNKILNNGLVKYYQVTIHLKEIPVDVCKKLSLPTSTNELPSKCLVWRLGDNSQEKETIENSTDHCPE